MRRLARQLFASIFLAPAPLEPKIKIVRLRMSDNSISIEMKPLEMRAFLEELAHILGGSRLPKVREICRALEVQFGLIDGAFNVPESAVKSTARKKS